MALKNHQPLDPAYLEKLQDYYAEHKVIPSYSVLATLWGISAKSWVSECVRRFEEAGYLDWTPDRQLKPGARFFERRLAHDTVQAGLPNPALADGYDLERTGNPVWLNAGPVHNVGVSIDSLPVRLTARS